jgi:hypothetical protein
MARYQSAVRSLPPRTVSASQDYRNEASNTHCSYALSSCSLMVTQRLINRYWTVKCTFAAAIIAIWSGLFCSCNFAACYDVYIRITAVHINTHYAAQQQCCE